MSVRGLFASTTIIALTVSFLAGCTAPVPTPAVDSQGSAIQMVDGWTYSTPSGSFDYRDGTLRGSVEGGQIVLQLHSSKPVDLGLLETYVNGRHDPDDYSSFSWHLALWERGEQWPEWYHAKSTTEEVASFQGDVLGQRIERAMTDPQAEILGAVLDRSGGFALSFKLAEPLVLRPGNWSLWLGFTKAVELEIEMVLPEATLSSDPLFSGGCKIDEASDFESPRLAQAVLVGSIADDAVWETQVTTGSMLLGYYFGGHGTISDAWYRYFEGDAAEPWEFRAQPGGPSNASPVDWRGTVFASATPGTHTFEIVHERVVYGGGPKMLYCVT